MKKLLSVVLALAMIISCISMISISAADESVGVKIEITEDIVGGHPYWRKASAGYTQDMAVDNVITVAYDVYNTSNHAIKFVLQPQNGWSTVSGLTAKKEIPAQSKDTVSVQIKTDGNGNVVKADGTVVCEISAISFRFDLDVGSNMTAGTSFIIASDNANDPIYGIGNMLLNGSSGGAATKTVVTTLPNLTVATPTPVADKAVVNGDAENGNTGWGNIHGGTTTIVADPDNANNHVAKHVASGAYHSVAFDLGAAIVQDAANGYKGAGVGTYKVTFKAKAEAGKGGSFNVLFNSKEHIGTGTAVGSYTTTDDTWVIGTSVELTDEWQEFTATVKVTEKYLNNIYEIFKAGKANAYQLVLRLDGSKDAFKESRFTYYVDDVTIEKEVEATPTPTAGADGTVAPGATATPTPTPAPTPNAIEIHALQDTTYYINSTTGVMDAADIKDGVLTKEITIENVGENDISVQLCIQATVKNSEGKDTWQGFANEGGYIEIAAGEKETLTVEVEFENGVTTILDQEVPVDKLFFRLNFNNNTTLNEGDGVLIYGDQDFVNGYLAKTSSDKITYATKVLNIKGSTSNTGDALPVALIATLAVATVALVVVAKKRKEN